MMFVERQLNRNNWGKWLASVGGWCSVAESMFREIAPVLSGNCREMAGKCWGMVQCCCKQCFGKLLLCFREIVGKWLASVGEDGAALLPAMFREIGGKLLTAFGKWRASFREIVGKLLGRCSVSVSSVSGNCSCAFGKLSGNGWQVLGDGAVLLQAVFRESAPVLSGNRREMAGKCWGGWCGVAASNVSGNWWEVSHIAFVSKQLPGHGLRLRTCNQRSIFRSRSSFLPNKMEMA